MPNNIHDKNLSSILKLHAYESKELFPHCKAVLNYQSLETMT